MRERRNEGAKIYPDPGRPSNDTPLKRWQNNVYLPLTLLAWMVVGIVAFWLLGHVSRALVIVILALILAFAMAPLVNLLRRWLIRPVAIGAAYLLGVGIVLGLGALLIATAAGQVVNLVKELPTYIDHMKSLGPQALAVLGPFGVTDANLTDFNTQILAELQVLGEALAAGSIGFISRFAAILLDVVLILMLSIYFTLDGIRVVAWLREETPTGSRRYIRYLIKVVNNVVGGYVRGTLLMALIIGLLVGVGLAVIGVRYAILLGVLAFLMQFIPVAGVLISGAISLLVSLPLGLSTTLIVLVYFVVVHVIESDVIGPRIMGKAVGIHPATGIIALLLGTELFGVWGALFGAPLAGLLQAILVGVWRARLDEPGETADIVVENPNDKGD